MQEQGLDFSDYIAAFKRRRLSITAIAVTVFLIGALAALLWPATYKSSATILIKEQDIPPELVQSTVTSYASQRIQAISQRVMTRSKLQEIINKYDLYADNRERLTSEEIIEEMRANISLDMIDAEVVDPRTGRPTAATIAFQLSFSGEYPDQVQKVANELMSLYLQENLRERSEKASETFAFLDTEAERLSDNIAKLEEKLAEFKKRHPNSLPQLAELNRQSMERTEREMTDIDTQLRSLEERRIMLQGQLAQLKPYGADVSVDPSTRLQALRTQYFGLVARYSEDHPDVIRTRREIEGLEQETGAGIESLMAAPCLNLIGKDTLEQSKALLRQAAVVLTPDAGPAHIASALGTPVIGLYAATWSRRSGPYNSLDLCVDRYEEAARKYRNRAAAEVRWGHRIEEPGVMDLVRPADVIGRLEAFTRRASS